MHPVPRDTIRTEITSEEQWHALRAKNVGASEAGALRGEHPFETAYSLSALKLGLTRPKLDNAAMARGRKLECVAIDELRDIHPDWKIWAPKAYYSDRKARLGCTPDCFFQEEGGGRAGVVQIKSVQPSVFERKWRDSEGNIVVPAWIRTQVMLEMHLTGLQLGFVAALVIGHGIELHLIEVAFDHEHIDRLYFAARAFWERVDGGRLCEPDFARDGGTIAEVLAQDDGTELDLSSDNELPGLVAQLERARTIAAETSALAAAAKARVLARIGTAAAVKYAGGTITAKTIEIKEHVVKASSTRRLTVRKDKGIDDE